jgi:hypothetical protein
MYLLTTRLAVWLRLARRDETWKTAEILIPRHQLAVLQRQQPRRPELNWADGALLATLLSVIPKARRHGLHLLVTPDTVLRWHRDIVRRRWAARSIQGKTGCPATRRNIRALVLRLARENPGWATAGAGAMCLLHYGGGAGVASLLTCCLSRGRSASRVKAFSMVGGTGSSFPSAMPRIVLRTILPERVLGSAAMMSTLRSAATGPIWSRISSTSSALSTPEGFSEMLLVWLRFLGMPLVEKVPETEPAGGPAGPGAGRQSPPSGYPWRLRAGTARPWPCTRWPRRPAGLPCPSECPFAWPGRTALRRVLCDDSGAAASSAWMAGSVLALRRTAASGAA